MDPLDLLSNSKHQQKMKTGARGYVLRIMLYHGIGRYFLDRVSPRVIMLA
jgi:hypothetical protein